MKRSLLIAILVFCLIMPSALAAPTRQRSQGFALRDAELLALIDGDLSSDEALAEALEALRAHPVMDRAQAELQRHADQARAHLAPLPDNAAKETLLRVCDELVTRSH